MSRAMMYAGSSAVQPVETAGTVVSFNSVIRRFGNGIGVSGGNVTISGEGYYDIDTNISFTVSAISTAVLTLYKDGVAIPNANATVTTGATGTYSISVPAAFREKCCCESVITAVLSGVDGNVTNAGVLIMKD